MQSVEQHNGGMALRAKAAARFIGVGESTFWRWVAAGRLPKGTRLSARATVWRLSDLQAFLEQAAQGGSA